jgi:hypothetical protein
MMSKTFTAAALVVGMMSVGAAAAPRPSDTAAREKTRQLNDQQLQGNGNTMQPAQQPLGSLAQPPQPPATPAPMAQPMPPAAPTLNDAATPGVPRTPQ